MAETEEEKTERRDISAKAISKIFKFAAAGGIIACAVAKWTGILPNAGAGEICMIWAAVYGIGAGTIDMNIMLDKFTGAK